MCVLSWVAGWPVFRRDLRIPHRGPPRAPARLERMPRWLLPFFLRFLSQDPPPPLSAVVVAVKPLDQRCVCSINQVTIALA